MITITIVSMDGMRVSGQSQRGIAREDDAIHIVGVPLSLCLSVFGLCCPVDLMTFFLVICTHVSPRGGLWVVWVVCVRGGCRFATARVVGACVPSAVFLFDTCLAGKGVERSP
jgi:hypothetical protein